ncbi:MAG: hypothetical protein IH585_10945 [Anaerolineaceae bacterium]|nr:hypothetical protein [Anaerolineaceae bacterium]
MKHKPNILVILSIVFILFLTLVELPVKSKSPMPENKVPGQVERVARRLMNDLKQQGYEVERGYFKLYTEEDCPVSFQELGNCYGNNPAAPYVLFSVPSWPEEFIDPATDEAFGINIDGFSTSYRLDPREAIIILGVLPPPASYLGFQTYLFTRQYAFDTDSATYLFMKDKPPLMRMFFLKVPQNPERVVNLASLSNSINHVVIAEQSGATFDQQRYFIITPDQFMDKTIRKTLNRISVKQEDIFTEPIPANMNLGLDEAADDFVTILRYAMPEDGGSQGTPSDTWRTDLPLVVLRVRDTKSGRPPMEYPDFTEPQERAISDEFYLKPDLINLVKAVSYRWGQPVVALNAMQMLRVQPAPINMVGPKCSQIGMNCLADTQDTSYQYSFPLPLYENNIYAVVGTLGTRTHNATYVGLGLTATIRMLGFENRSDTDLANTASAYATEVNNTDKFFVYYFTRDCSGLETLTGGHCLEISDSDLPLCDDPTAATCNKLSISLRDYMPLGSQRGPNDNYILPAMVIPLQRP